MCVCVRVSVEAVRVPLLAGVPSGLGSEGSSLSKRGRVREG